MFYILNYKTVILIRNNKISIGNQNSVLENVSLFGEHLISLGLK